MQGSDASTLDKDDSTTWPTKVTLAGRFTDTSGTNNTSFGETKLDGREFTVSSVAEDSSGYKYLLLSTTDTDTVNITDTDIQVLHTEASDVEAFFDELGLIEMVNDPKFATPEARIENKEIVRDAMIEALKSDTAENWEKRLAPRGVPVAKINSVKETARLEQLQYRNILTAVPAAKGMASGYRLPGAPFTNSEDGPEVMRPAPVLGQHTLEILEEIGIDKSVINTLAAEAVICKAD